VRPSDVFAVDRDLAAPGRGVLGAAATVRRSEDWRREVALRLALASLPCMVLILYLPAILGRGGTSWVVPLAMAFANAWLAVSVARELLRGRWFLVFWALYGLAWIAVAWHGAHFHRPPRPAALLMNLEEILETPFPAWSEMPWIVLAGFLGLGWLANRLSPPRAPGRLATAGAVIVFAVLHAVALLRYQTTDMLRFSQYDDLVRTQGLEGAVVLDGLELLRGPDSAAILRGLREDAAARPPVPLPLDPIRVDRVIVVQLESIDRESVAAETMPALFRLWDGATHGVLDPLRTSVSGSSAADFQLLTGLRPLAGVPVYKLAWDGASGGLPAYAAVRGFAFHAYHGNERHFWNRGPFLAALGATFHSAESIPQSEFSRWGRADGDLLRYGAATIRSAGRAVHFLITLSTHAPFDLVEPAAHLPGPTRAHYLQSVGYLDAALGRFLEAVPKDGATLVVLYSDHESIVHGGSDEASVPMILGRLSGDASLAPLSRQGRPVRALEGVYEVSSLHRYLGDCLDATAH